MSYEYYEVVEEFARYPVGTLLYLVDELKFPVNTMGVSNGWCRSFCIGTEYEGPPKDCLAFYCISKSGLENNRKFFKRVYPQREESNV